MAQLRGTTIISEDTALAVKQNTSTESFKIVTSSNSGSSLVSNLDNNLLSHDLKVEGNSEFDQDFKINSSEGIKLKKGTSNSYGRIYLKSDGNIYFNNGSEFHLVVSGTNTGLLAASGTDSGSAIAAKKLVEGDKLTSNAISKGNNTKLIYFSSGVPVESTGIVGGYNGNNSTFKPVYLNNGSITAASSSISIGNSAKPIYMNNGELTVISSKVGGSNHPVWLNDGEITACSGTIGSTNKPIYINDGTFTTISGNIGLETKPVYISGGAITACKYSLNADFNGLGTTATTASKGTHTHSTSSTTFTVYYSDGTNGTVSVLTGVSTPNS